MRQAEGVMRVMFGGLLGLAISVCAALAQNQGTRSGYCAGALSRLLLLSTGASAAGADPAPASAAM